MEITNNKKKVTIYFIESVHNTDAKKQSLEKL